MSRLDTRARQLLRLREVAADAATEEKRAKAERDAFEVEFWGELEGFGMKSFALDDGTRLARRETLYHEVYDVDELFAWAKENGMAQEWFGQTERKAALNEFVRSAHENGTPLPPGLGPRWKRFLSVTKPPAK